MKVNARVMFRVIILIISLLLIIYFHKETSKTNLMWMFVGLAGVLGVLFDYNYQFNHPVKFDDL